MQSDCGSAQPRQNVHHPRRGAFFCSRCGHGNVWRRVLCGLVAGGYSVLSQGSSHMPGFLAATKQVFEIDRKRRHSSCRETSPSRLPRPMAWVWAQRVRRATLRFFSLSRLAAAAGVEHGSHSLVAHQTLPEACRPIRVTLQHARFSKFKHTLHCFVQNNDCNYQRFPLRQDWQESGH